MARRVSFLIGKDGKILHVTDNPKAEIHLAEMKDAVAGLTRSSKEGVRKSNTYAAGVLGSSRAMTASRTTTTAARVAQKMAPPLPAVPLTFHESFLS